MNRQQRRAQARQKGQGMSYADQLAKRQIGRQTLRMAMEDEAVALAADIKCQQMLWGAVIALNEKFGFGEKRTRDFLASMGQIADEFEAMRAENGYEYAEEKLRQGRELREMRRQHADPASPCARCKRDSCPQLCFPRQNWNKRRRDNGKP